MKKYITFVVPCYNSQDYMKRCIDSLLIGKEAVEIIIIDDGSHDATPEIADEYAKKYPDIVRVIHQENGGHGSGINAGLRAAQGIYFKVVDSDDWLKESAYQKVLERIKSYCVREERERLVNMPDLIICNYAYNHIEEQKKHMVHYRNVFPQEAIFGWEDMGKFRPSQYLIMHALIYRTEILKKSGISLPEHTFYVDNIFACQPLPYVKTLYYMNEDLYQYYLGREDQSVNEKVLISRIDQQIKVTKIIAECVDLKEVKKQSPKLASYLCRNISIMMTISTIHLLLAGNRESAAKRRTLWKDIKIQNPKLYCLLKYTKLSGFTDLPGIAGKKLAVGGYRLAKKIYKFQ